MVLWNVKHLLQLLTIIVTIEKDAQVISITFTSPSRIISCFNEWQTYHRASSSSIRRPLPFTPIFWWLNFSILKTRVPLLNKFLNLVRPFLFRVTPFSSFFHLPSVILQQIQLLDERRPSPLQARLGLIWSSSRSSESDLLMLYLWREGF